jgi:Mce-associated membrane protein
VSRRASAAPALSHLLALGERIPRRNRRLLTAGAVAVIIAGVLAAAVLGWWWRAEVRAEAADRAVLAEAENRAEALLSYDAAHLDADLARGRAQVTGDFAARYERTATEVIAPAARTRRIVTLTGVTRSALVRTDPGRVEALLFINQAVTAADQPVPRPLSSQVLVTLIRVGDQWLISELRPL